MRDFLEKKWLGLQWKAGEFLSRLKEEERGDTNFVAIIVIIVIIIGIAAVFQEQLTRAVKLAMDKLLEFIGM